MMMASDPILPPACECPLCAATQLAPVDQEVDVIEVLQRWEREANVRFQDDVWRSYAARRAVRLHRCTRCGLALFLPEAAGTAGFYRDITAGDYYVSDKWEFRRAIRDLRKLQPRRVLDIGCGSGFFLDDVRARLRGCEPWGYEFDPGLTEKAQARGHTVCSGDFPAAPLARNGAEPFDALTSFQVLEHLADPATFLRQAHALLKPDGIFVVCVPDAAGPVRHFNTALTDLPPHHVSRWCAKAFRVGMPRLGFRVLKVAYEPLPHYLWDAYLPVILAKDFWPGPLGRWFNRRGWTARTIRALRRLGVRWLRPVRGHTLYVLLQAVGQPDAGGRKTRACAA
jgi:SAM-dependent methyltransferase